MFLFKNWRSTGAADAVERAYGLIVASIQTQQVINIDNHPVVRLAGADGAMSVIADDSDHHRRRRGLMVYPSVALCAFGGDSVWALALGHKGGSYPGSEYAYDLMAFRYYVGKEERFPLRFDDKEFEEFVGLMGDKNDWFHSSLLTVMADGRLRIRQSRILDLLKPHLEKVVLPNDSHRASRFFQHGGVTDIGGDCRFRRDFPDLLARSIRKYMSEMSVRTARSHISTLQTI